MRYIAPLMAALLIASLLPGCDEDNPRSGCTSDGDCRDGRICLSGQCQFSDDGGDETEDVGDEDVEEAKDAAGDTEDADTSPPDTSDDADTSHTVDAPDVSDPRTVCEEALATIEACPELVFTDGKYDLNWPVCASDRDQCAARCLLRHDCAELQCDFNPDIDCDAPGPVWECLQNECDAATSCEDNSGCESTYDCCSDSWICFDEDNPPVTCDVECMPPPEPPAPCGCREGTCQSGERPDNVICRQALNHMENCGYDISELQETNPRDYAYLQQMEFSCQDPYLVCYAECLAFPEEDQCQECHFGAQPCLRDPFGECIEDCGNPNRPLCHATGGIWDNSSCPNCCGPTSCGEDPAEECFDDCCGEPQCVCPDDRPFWSFSRGCYDDPACYP